MTTNQNKISSTSLINLSDINLVSYLIHKGFQVKSTQQNGRYVEFLFDPQVEAQANAWQFSPTEGMKLIQGFLLEKDKLLGFLKTKQNKGVSYGLD